MALCNVVRLTLRGNPGQWRGYFFCGFGTDSKSMDKRMVGVLLAGFSIVTPTSRQDLEPAALCTLQPREIQ